MTRTNARELAVHLSYAMSFSSLPTEEFLEKQLSREVFELFRSEYSLYEDFPNDKQLRYIQSLVKGVCDHGAELDGYIAKYSVGWSFSRISRVAAAIMRVAMFEILYVPEVPNAAAINEAVELAKGYEEPQVVSFINGILGSFVRTEFPLEGGTKPVKTEKQTGGEEL